MFNKVDKLLAVMGVELVVDMANVCLRRADSYAEFFLHVGEAPTFREQFEDLRLARGQAVGCA